ncbi:MAG: hypothetical protein CK533_09715 [Acidobacterium sp.]|nr:hypothetical protein [Acidobacteriota bacterium]PHY10401.1 MAG: hypothetical protein CK533_09715 [Acidobacterium sp.]
MTSETEAELQRDLTAAATLVDEQRRTQFDNVARIARLIAGASFTKKGRFALSYYLPSTALKADVRLTRVVNPYAARTVTSGPRFLFRRAARGRGSRPLRHYTCLCRIS